MKSSKNPFFKRGFGRALSSVSAIALAIIHPNL
jgi:hypothetical protein